MSALDRLLAILDLETTEDDRFRGGNIDVGWPRLFGGQLIAQALVAAGRTVESREPHSFHGHFLRSGALDAPVDYRVERLRDGSTFSTRQVHAVQTETIFTATVSLKAAEPGLDHQAETIPDVPPPEELLDGVAMREAFRAAAPPFLKRYWERPSPIDLRPVSLKRFLTRDRLEPRHLVWFRADGPMPDEPLLHAAVLGFASDMMLLDTALFPHRRTIFDPDMQIASLDHSLWFHRPFRADGWLLFVQNSPSAAGSLGLARGDFFTRDGGLIASVVQQGLIRHHAAETGS